MTFSKKHLIFLLMSTTLLSGCGHFLYGKSNAPEPVDRPKLENPIQETSVVWHHNLGKGSEILKYKLTPVTDGTSVFAISEDGHFYRFNAQTGEKELEVKLGKNITAGLGVSPNALFAGTESGALIAISPRDGSVLWRTALSGKLLAAPMFGDNMIVAKTMDGTVTALDPSDGTVLWRYALENPLFTMYGSSPALVGGGVVISTDSDGFFTVLNEQNGFPVVRNRMAMGTTSSTSDNMVDQIATPQVNGKTLFASAYQHMVYAVDLENGQTVWKNTNFSTIKDFALSPTALYLSTPTSQLVALSQADGRQLWTNAQLLGRQISPPVAVPNRVAVVDNEGYLYWFDSNDGKLIGEKRIGKVGASSTAVVLQNLIIWQLNNGQLVAFRPN